MLLTWDAYDPAVSGSGYCTVSAPHGEYGNGLFLSCVNPSATEFVLHASPNRQNQDDCLKALGAPRRPKQVTFAAGDGVMQPGPVDDKILQD